ncbi:MAG: hypothetical protein E4H40_05005 [Candidatus Brocadiia bacterium]|nr:MAG: hypothetical protein E4H40_05005 [Candidatus Brocadiia bacterium]
MNIIETFCIAVVFAAIFLFGENLHIVYRTHKRRALSAAGGAAVAYVFIHFLPELALAGDTFVEITAGRSLPMPEYRVYLAALMGFILFYGLEHMVHWSGQSGRREKAGYGISDPIFLLHTGGFALYAGLISYLMVRGIDEKSVPILIYGIAMGLHFLSIDHSMHHEHGSMYDKFGKWILAVAALAGWACGILTEFPKPVVITMLGLVSGGVVMNSMIVELPGEKDGRFLYFCAGAAAYSILLFFV